MKYRNMRTGAVIEVASECFGDEWEEVKAPPKAQKKPKQEKEKPQEEEE